MSISRFFAAARPYLQTRCNELHTSVCLRFALRLLEAEGGDPSIVVPGILLHDVGWSRVPEQLQLTAFGPNMTNTTLRDVHEREGAALARTILAELDYPEPLSGRIAQIVSRHDSRVDAESLEEAIIKDADKLWRYSHEASMTDPQRFGISKDENLRRIGDTLEDWFLTPTGRTIARDELCTRWREFREEACACAHG